MQLNKILLLFFTSIIFYLYIKIKNKIVKKTLLFILILFLTIPFCFREYFFPLTMGEDYYNYKFWFERLTLNNIGTINNIGFNIFIIIIKKTYDNFIFFLFCCGIFYNLLIIKFIRSLRSLNSIQQLFAYIVYICFIYFLSYNILRQCLSCSIVLYSLKYIKNKKFLKFIISILVASSFHISSISLFFIYPYLRIKMNLLLKNFMLAIITISIYKYFEKIIDYMFSFLKLFNINYVGKYDAIMFQETNNYVPVLIFLFIWLLIFILNYKTKNKIRNNLDLSFLSLMVIILGTKNLIFARMSIYYFSSIILFLPMTSKVFREANGIEIYILIMSLLSIYSYVN